MWGDFRRYSAEMKGTILEIDPYADIDKMKNKDIPNIVSKQLCKKVDHQISDLNVWYETEISNRLNFLKRLEEQKQKYLVKLFVDDQRWFDFDFSNKQCLILYRQNFLEAVLSILIKNYYQTHLNWKDGFRDRYKGNFITVPDFSFKLDYEYFYYRFIPFLNLLKFIKKNNHIEKICYEDLFIKNSNEEIHIFDRYVTLHDVEKKLNYSKEKCDYIENYLELKEWFLVQIKKEKLEDICEELGMCYEL